MYFESTSHLFAFSKTQKIVIQFFIWYKVRKEMIFIFFLCMWCFFPFTILSSLFQFILRCKNEALNSMKKHVALGDENHGKKQGQLRYFWFYLCVFVCTYKLRITVQPAFDLCIIHPRTWRKYTFNIYLYFLAYSLSLRLIFLFIFFILNNVNI